MNAKRIHTARTWSCLLALLIPPFAVAQQDTPAKPIRIVVGVAPGGATDILARVLGDEDWARTCASR